MHFTFIATLIALGLFFAMAVLLEIGHRLGVRKMQKEGAEAPGLGAVEGAIFSLLGLLIAFSFSGAASRFDDRRHLVVEEANDIGTAYLRIDLLPADKQPEMRDLFRQYLDLRLSAYKKLPDIEAAKAELIKSVDLQGVIWKRAVVACQSSPPSTTGLVLSSLNSMIDITTTRMMATQMHPPAILFIMLVFLALTSALIAGFGMSGKKRSWIHIIGFCAAISVTVFIIIDLEFPRLGFIRLDAFDQVLVDLRESMK